GVPPFFEPGLEERLREVVRSRRLRSTTNVHEAVMSSDVTFVTVGTPSRRDGSIDLQFIERSAEEVGRALAAKDGYHLVVVKSTVIPGTTGNIVKPIVERFSGKRCGPDFGLCMSPEFLREGSAVEDTLKPDRVVIGEFDRRSGDTLKKLFNEFYGGDIPILRTNLATAEMTKYANNSFLATKISFINSIANICDKVPGTDVEVVAKAIGMDHRINPRFLRAGLGWGGSCFPKDVKALLSFSRSLSYEAPILWAALEVNDAQPLQAVGLARRKLGSLKGRRVAVLGLAFKPDTDDIRESRATVLIDALLQEGARVIAYDPKALDASRNFLGKGIEYAESAESCLKGAECCIVATEWREFEKLQPEDFVSLMKKPVVIDGRRVFNPGDFGGKVDFAAIGLGEAPALEKD
ncbi:MAG: UDP-glucose/GDP-mannose dehydrogenase family protein, partial [Nitrososphaeria archaeon]